MSLLPKLLLLAPPLAALVLVLSFAVEVPRGDEWDTPGGLLVRLTKDSMSWEYFVAQHNESRMAVPRAIYGVGTLLFGWRVVPYMVLGWLFVLASLALLLKLLAADSTDRSAIVPWVGLLFACLLFSPIQEENQLWGFQMVVFIPPLCLVAGLWAQTTKISYRNVVLACALFSLIAMWSFANGVLCWVLAFPLVRYWLAEGGTIPTERRKSIAVWTAVYLALGAASVLVYFWDYRRPPNHPSMGAVLEDPAAALSYFATWLGNPFLSALAVDPVRAASILGTFLLLVLCVVSVWIVRQPGARSAGRFWLPYYPWICITTYGILSGLVTTLGRAGFGQEQAIAGRYRTPALWMVIGLVGMVAVLWRSQAGRQFNSAHVLGLLVGGAVCYLTLVSWESGVRLFEEAEHRASQQLLTLRLVEVAPANPLIGCSLPECLYPRSRRVVRLAPLLSEAGVLRVDFIGSWLTDRLRSPAGESGEFWITGEGENRVRFTGWTALPGEDRAPDFVALARADGAGGGELVSGLILTDHLHPAASPSASADSGRVLFAQSLEMSVAEAKGLRLFAVDLSSRQVYSLARLMAREASPAAGAGRGQVDALEQAAAILTG